MAATLAARRRLRRQKAAAWLYVLPALAVFALFIAYPILANILGSLRDTHGGATLANYHQAGADPVFWIALRNTALWVVLCVIF